MDYEAVMAIIFLIGIAAMLPIQLWHWWPTLVSYVEDREIQYRVTSRVHFMSDKIKTIEQSLFNYGIIYFIALLFAAAAWPLATPAALLMAVLYAIKMRNRAKRLQSEQATSESA